MSFSPLVRPSADVPVAATPVIGCEAVGLNAIMGPIVAGAGRVTAVDPMPSRRKLALTIGATDATAPGDLAG